MRKSILRLRNYPISWCAVFLSMGAITFMPRLARVGRDRFGISFAGREVDSGGYKGFQPLILVILKWSNVGYEG